MELLYKKDIDFSRISKLICIKNNKGHLLFYDRVSNNTKAAQCVVTSPPYVQVLAPVDGSSKQEYKMRASAT